MPRNLSALAALKLLGIALAANFGLVQAACAQAAKTPPQASETWTPLASMPEPQCEGGTAVLNGRIYVMGGWKDEQGPYKLTQIYDVAANSWSEGVALPEAVHHEGVAMVDRRRRDLCRRRLSQSVPKARADRSCLGIRPGARANGPPALPLPAPRGALFVAAIGNLIYAAGGEHRHPPGRRLTLGAPACLRAGR